MKYANLTRGDGFVPWQPSTWPASPDAWDPDFTCVVRVIFQETVIDEIDNVIRDALTCNGDLTHRGHVVGIALLCAIDTFSSYAYRTDVARCPTCSRTDGVGPRYTTFVEQHFPAQYRPFARDLYQLYRNSMVHSWHLFQASILPGGEPVTKTYGALGFGLLNMFDALRIGMEDFLRELRDSSQLQQHTLTRYEQLRRTAVP